MNKYLLIMVSMCLVISTAFAGRVAGVGHGVGVGKAGRYPVTGPRPGVNPPGVGAPGVGVRPNPVAGPGRGAPGVGVRPNPVRY